MNVRKAIDIKVKEWGGSVRAFLQIEGDIN